MRICMIWLQPCFAFYTLFVYSRNWNVDNARCIPFTSIWAIYRILPPTLRDHVWAQEAHHLSTVRAYNRHPNRDFKLQVCICTCKITVELRNMRGSGWGLLLIVSRRRHRLLVGYWKKNEMFSAEMYRRTHAAVSDYEKWKYHFENLFTWHAWRRAGFYTRSAPGVSEVGINLYSKSIWILLPIETP